MKDPKVQVHQEEEGFYGYVGDFPLGMGGRLFEVGFRPARFGKKETLLISARIAIEKMKKKRKPKAYNEHGLAGCVQKTRSRKTGTMVGVYNAEQAGLDTEGGPWAVICEEHDSVVNFPSITTARSWAPTPHEFCDECQKETA